MTTFAIDDNEWAAMRQVDLLARDLYAALRRRMNYATGIVGGAAAAISWWALREDTEMPGRPGVKACKPSEQQLRRRIAQLQKVGLVESIGNNLRLRFRLPLARTNSLVQKKAEGGPVAHQTAVKASRSKASKAYAQGNSSAKADTHQVSGFLKPSPPTPSRLRRDGDGEIDPPTPAAREEDNPDATPIGTHPQQPSEQRHEPAKRGGRGPSARRSDEEVAADIAFEKHLKWPRGLPHHQRAFIARTSRDLGPVLAQRVLDEWHGAKQAGIVGRDWPYFNSLVRAAKEQGDAWETVYAEQVAADREHALRKLAEQAAREQRFGAEIGGKAGPLPPGGLSQLAKTLLRRSA
ncbi:hypothetical protein [Cupriavidus gilardii]|uniref:hypothetical protein n=1 Tax=Cupriavidus gilardii TaxID=82541 RepID=UPI0007E35490|nr:hypothetical protein [Cupriavidus gilardii]